MSRTRMISATRARALFTVGLLFLLPVALWADSEIERVVEARPDGLVTITNIAGSVVVTGWDRNEVEVTGTLGRGVEELEIESRGRSVEIEVELVSRSRGRNGNAELEIRVPHGSEVDVEVISADVEVSEVGGEVEVESVSGSIDVEGEPQELDLESVSGSIDVDVGGEVRQAAVESVSGRIRLRGAIREIEADTVSGEIEIETGEIRRAELSTTSGHIEIIGSLAAGAEIEAESHSGSVKLGLPSGTSARFDVATHSGRITNELGPPPDRNRYGPGKELEFTIGGGAARVTIDTFSGSVDLRRRD